MYTLLIVDDTPENLFLLGELLQPHYRVRAANSGRRALEVARSTPAPDLVLLDVMMPEMDGYTVLARLKADPATATIPVIFVTALDGGADEERGLAAGAVDYISKPIKPAVLMARVKAHLELKSARDWLHDRNLALEAEVARRMHENLLIQDVTIRALACLAEIRDPETGGHLRRTQHYVELLAVRLREHPRYRDFLTHANVQALIKSAPLHDIGKVGIPDHVLLKPGSLNADEWRVMRTHSRLGAEAIAQAERDLPHPLAFLRVAKDITRSHHERWDGTGYPDGLAGEAIPIPARLMALADVLDALTSERPYKRAFPFAEAAQLIAEGRGTHFDPAVVDAFLDAREAFEAVAIAHHEDLAEAI
jgi:putative two-component system response regulator